MRRYRSGGQMSLHAPKLLVFIVSLILFVIAWIGVFTPIPVIDEHPSILITIAYIVLALGCLVRAELGELAAHNDFLPDTQLRSTCPIAPLADTGCGGTTHGTVPPITPLYDAIFPYGPALLVPGVIGSKKADQNIVAVVLTFVCSERAAHDEAIPRQTTAAGSGGTLLAHSTK